MNYLPENHKRKNVFILAKDSTIGENPYIQQLLDGLRGFPLNIRYGSLQVLFEQQTLSNLDILHIHWPSDILVNNYRNPDNYTHSINNLIRSLDPRTKIICTVHNLCPHSDQTAAGLGFHLNLYQLCHGLIHLEENSLDLVLEKIRDRKASLPSMTVIKHGNYNCYGPFTSRPYCPSRKPVITTLGNIRSIKDLNLLLKFSSIASRQGLHLQIFSKLNLIKHKVLSPSTLLCRLRIEIVLIYARIRLYLSKAKYTNRRLPAIEISQVLSSSDIFFIPRTDCLNSGLVSLAFTYANVVIGPAIGNIEPQLRHTLNPLYADISDASLYSALEQAFKLYESNHGTLNRQYSQVSMSWEKISQQHYDFYEYITKLP